MLKFSVLENDLEQNKSKQIIAKVIGVPGFLPITVNNNFLYEQWRLGTFINIKKGNKFY